MSEMPPLPVTVKHLATLRAIRDLSRRNGYPPLYAELAAALEVAKSTIASRLATMAALGLVKYDRNSPRTVALTSRGWGVIR